MTREDNSLVKFRRSVALVTVGFMVTATAPGAQSGAQRTSEAAAVSAILVDVVVRDRAGQPVADLRPEEFEILEDGVAQTIGGFTPIFRTSDADTGAGRPAASQPPVTTPQASPEALAMPTEVLALVFDRLTPDARALAYRAALAYTEGNVRADRVVGVYGLDLTLIPYQAFTRDLGAVRKSLDAFANRATSQFSGSRGEREQLATRQAAAGAAASAAEQSAAAGGPGAGQSAGAIGGAQVDLQMAEMQSRMLQTFETLERDQRGYSTANGLMAVVSSMRNMPGRKAVIFFSEGLSIPPNVEDRFTSVVAAANRANVSIYTMDAAGLRTESTLKEARDELMAASETTLRRNPSKDVSGTMTQALERNEDRLRMDPQSGLTRIADATGGLLVANTNDFRRGLARVDSDLRNYYMLSYVPANNEFDGRFREIAVRVNRPGLSVQHRKGYFAVRAPAGEPVLSYEAPVLAMLDRTPVPNAFPFRASALRFPEAGRPGLTPIVAEVPTANLTFQPSSEDPTKYRSDFTVLVRIQDQQGQPVEKMSQRYELQGPVDQMEQARAGDVIFYRQAELPPGLYTLETIVYDALANKASVRVATVENRSVDPERLRLSSLMIVRRGERVTDADRDPGNPLYVGDTLLYPNLGAPLKAGVDKELPFYFTAYLGAGGNPKASLEVLQNARILAKAPLELSTADETHRIQQVSRIPIDQLSPGSYELRVTVQQGTSGISHTTPFRIIG
jgi:VWFA-related protein